MAGELLLSRSYAGFSAQVTDYLITSEVRGDNGTKSRLSQILRYVQVPLFQFGVFYGKGVDLEIAPGANMTFTLKCGNWAVARRFCCRTIRAITVFAGSQGRKVVYFLTLAPITVLPPSVSTKFCRTTLFFR